MSETFRPVSDELDVSGSYTDFVLLREGANTRLFRASKAGKYFAIKTTKDNSAMQLAMLKREYELSVKLNHFHLPHFFTYEAHTPVGPGIVMEYVDGRSLNEFLAENPPLDTRRRVLAQIFTAVGYIHKNGIIHNDLKPENILITYANNDVKLLDFGLSNTDAHYLTKTLGCTRDYASPELLAQSEDIDARSDIYSIGKIMQRIFPHRYRRFWKKCLRENRDKRWDNVDQLYRSWNKADSYKIYFWLVFVMLVLVGATFFVSNRGTIDEAQQQQLLDSLSSARSEMVKAQNEAADAKMEVVKTQHQLDSVTAIQQKTEAEQRRVKQERDSLVNGMKKAIENRYKIADDSVKIIPFQEFALFVYLNATKEAQEITKRYASMTEDEVTKAVLTDVSTQMYSYYAELYNKTLKKKSVHDLDNTSDEFYFYYELYTNNKPYRKFNPAKDKVVNLYKKAEEDAKRITE